MVEEKSLKERLGQVRGSLFAIVNKFNKDISDFEYHTGLKINLGIYVTSKTKRLQIDSIELQSPTLGKVK